MDRAVLAGVVDPHVVAALAIFAECDTRTFRIADDVVLDNPALAPMSADEANLLGGGRGPLRRRLTEVESADGNEITAGLIRIKAAIPDVDFDEFLVRIPALEIGVDPGLVV